VLSQQLSGAAVILGWSAYIHPRLIWGVYGVKYATLITVIVGGLAHRSGESIQEEPELNLRSKMSDSWSCRVVSGYSIGGSESAVSCCMAGSEAVQKVRR